jgi:hypothetical protein
MSHRGEQNDNELQFKHFIEHLRSVELNLLLHLILQGFYSISHTSTHIKHHISRVLTRLVVGVSRPGGPWADE